MPLKKSEGNMYPWATHTHTHLGGECPHKCVYCYVNGFRGRSAKYQGELRLIENEFKVNYGAGKTIFIEHCNDLFAAAVPNEFIIRVLLHCQEYPQNTYVFQTKNPERYREFVPYFPSSIILGTTIESNRDLAWINNAPSPGKRFIAMVDLPMFLARKRPFGLQVRTFITIEPILDFDIEPLVFWIKRINPEFVNIGADSKNHHLPEPPQSNIYELVEALKAAGIEVRLKENLKRLFPW